MENEDDGSTRRRRGWLVGQIRWSHCQVAIWRRIMMCSRIVHRNGSTQWRITFHFMWTRDNITTCWEVWCGEGGLYVRGRGPWTYRIGVKLQKKVRGESKSPSKLVHVPITAVLGLEGGGRREGWSGGENVVETVRNLWRVHIPMTPTEMAPMAVLGQKWRWWTASSDNRSLPPVPITQER